MIGNAVVIPVHLGTQKELSPGEGAREDSAL